MKSFQFLKYLKKLLPIILVVCVLATCGIYYKLKSSNTYVASEVIHYNDPQTEMGYTPTGAKFDVNEIKSSSVMSKVVDKMALTGIYSVDSLISRITLTPIPDEDKVAQKEAKLEEGEEYIYEPSTYIISFAATDSEGPDFARTMLDEILDVYFAEYSQKYVNIAPAHNLIDNIENENYDYLEILELIDSGIDETLTTLYQRMDQSPYYRATQTGLSFGDLADEFNYLRDIQLSGLFSRTYTYQITKNKTILVADYANRIDSNNVSQNTEESIVLDTLAIIDAYVKKMRESGNTNITYEYILDDVYERNLVDAYGNVFPYGDQTVTYDELIYGWRDHNEAKEHLIIDTAYCHYVINAFQACTGACKNKECQSSLQTCAQIHNKNYPQIQAQVDEEIKLLVEQLTELYHQTQETNDEYNQYLGASYISVLSTASVKPSINVTLYTVIAFVFMVLLLGGGAVVLVRLGDILHYVFYTDHLTELNNRAYFDKYLKSMDKKLLDDGTVYCIVEIANLAAINSEHTRQIGDEILKMFTQYLKENFGRTNAEFIYNGNGIFVILAQNVDYITIEDIIGLFALKLDSREEHSDIRIEYNVGIAETFQEPQTARKLLTSAIKNKKSYNSDPTAPEKVTE